MANNYDRAYEFGNGLVLNSDEGSPYVTGGSASPIGLALPEQTIYVQGTPTGVLVWKKYNDNPNSWRLLGAEDLYFDPSIRGFSPTINTIQKAIDALDQGVGSGVSVTIICGKNGNLTNGSYYDNEGVPTNITPVDVSLKGVFLKSVAFRNENNVNGTMDIEYYDDNTSQWVVGYTLNVPNAEFSLVRGLDIVFPDNPQIRCVANKACKNPKLTLSFKGDSTT